jgi:hypothetical protein
LGGQVTGGQCVDGQEKSDPDFYTVLLLLVRQLNFASAALASGKK